MEHATRAALVLGSGGARGYAHIGAIQVLEERGIEIVAVSGASMGALVGGLYAAGKLQEYTDWIRGLTQVDVLRLLDPSLAAPGVIRAEKIFAHVHELVGDVSIEDLPVTFTAVATDLFARKAVWFQRGPLETAMRASIAIPGVFTPVMLNGRLLVDGGVMDPVPLAAIASSAADVTIAIDLGGERSGMPHGGSAGETAEERPIEEWIERFRRGPAHLIDRDLVRSVMSRFGGASSSIPVGDEATSPGGAAVESLPARLSKFDVINQSLETMQSEITRLRLASNPPDVLITISKDACRTIDFHRAAEMIELGRTATLEALGSGAALSL
ncbi:MAG: patatin-like phospholipase family protein [Acidimicrobiales bacterium]